MGRARGRRHGQHRRRVVEHGPRLPWHQRRASAGRSRRRRSPTAGACSPIGQRVWCASVASPWAARCGPPPGRRTWWSAMRRRSPARSPGLGSTRQWRPGGWPPTCCTRHWSSGSPTALQRYPRMLDQAYAEHDKLARLFARLLGRPDRNAAGVECGAALADPRRTGPTHRQRLVAPRPPRRSRNRRSPRPHRDEARPRRLTPLRERQPQPRQHGGRGEFGGQRRGDGALSAKSWRRSMISSTRPYGVAWSPRTM